MLLKTIIFIFSILYYANASCPNGTIPGNTTDVCYNVFNGPANFAQAEIQCAQLGGHLASANDAFTNSVLLKIAMANFVVPGSLWLGGTNLLLSGVWTWMNGRNISYTNWARRRPTNFTTDNSISMRIPSGEWYDDSYGVELPYICELPQATVANCLQDWTYFEFTDKCYKADCGNSDWNGAYHNCLNQAGDLVSIASQLENFMVYTLSFMTLCKSAFNFIGGNKVNNTWVWSDNSIFNYTHWYTNCDGDSNCNMNNPYIGYYLGIGDGNWTTLPLNDEFCNCCECIYNGYICESHPF